MTQDKIKKCHVLKCAGCSLRAEGFFCSLDVLSRVLGSVVEPEPEP
jgi:hypothetical protein